MSAKCTKHLVKICKSGFWILRSQSDGSIAAFGYKPSLDVGPRNTGRSRKEPRLVGANAAVVATICSTPGFVCTAIDGYTCRMLVLSSRMKDQ